MQADFLRHGKTTAGSSYIGVSDVLLTDEGFEQMENSVQQLLDTNDSLPWDCIVSSPLKRCAIYAENLANQLQIPVVYEESIKEYDFGDWETKTAVEVMSLFPGQLENFWLDPSANPPANGERLSEFTYRIDNVLRKLRTKQAGKNLLVICHGGVIRYLLSKVDGKPVNEMLKYPVAHGEIVRIDLG